MHVFFRGANAPLNAFLHFACPKKRPPWRKKRPPWKKKDAPLKCRTARKFGCAPAKCYVGRRVSWPFHPSLFHVNMIHPRETLYIAGLFHGCGTDAAHSACDTKFCHRDFVLKYVVIGEKKDFQVESGLFRDLFWSRSGLFIAICTKIQNCLK